MQYWFPRYLFAWSWFIQWIALSCLNDQGQKVSDRLEMYQECCAYISQRKVHYLLLLGVTSHNFLHTVRKHQTCNPPKPSLSLAWTTSWIYSWLSWVQILSHTCKWPTGCLLPVGVINLVMFYLDIYLFLIIWVKCLKTHWISILRPSPQIYETANWSLRQSDEEVNKKNKTKIHIYLNKLPNISVWKQTFSRG